VADEEQPAETPSLEQLERALAESRAEGDIAAYFAAEVALEDAVLAEAWKDFGAPRYEEAAEKFERVAQLNRELLDALERAPPSASPEEGPDADQLRDWSDQGRYVMFMANGHAAIARGQLHQIHRNPGTAVDFFGKAETAFREAAVDLADEVAAFFADYAAALKEFAAGMEDSVRGDYDAARSSYQRAKGRYHVLQEQAARLATVDDTQKLFSNLLPMVVFEAATIAAQFEKASYMAHFSQGEYEAAAENAANLTALLESTVASIPEQVPAWQASVVRAQLAWAEADRARATAFVKREEERWGEAEDAYAEARKKLEEAAAFMLRSGLPDAVAAQEALMSQASVTIAAELRQCKDEEALKGEVKKLRAERDNLLGRLGAAGVSVTNIQEATAVAEQNTQITLRIEQSVRETLPDLRAAIEAAQLGPEGERLKAEAAALEASGEHSGSFLERAKEFTEKVAAVVKNVGEAAAPIIPVLRVLAPLVGLPTF
jgi:hypothetical protein